MEAISNAGAVVGVRTNEGVILAAEKKISSKVRPLVARLALHACWRVQPAPSACLERRDGWHSGVWRAVSSQLGLLLGAYITGGVAVWCSTLPFASTTTTVQRIYHVHWFICHLHACNGWQPKAQARAGLAACHSSLLMLKGSCWLDSDTEHR